MAKSIDWYCTRKGCKTCKKTNEYLEEKKLTVKDAGANRQSQGSRDHEGQDIAHRLQRRNV